MYSFVELDPTSGGSKVAADVIAVGLNNLEFQRVKVSWGPENTANETDTANPFPVQLAGGASFVVEDAASAANPTGSPAMLRRRDTPTAAEVSADSDYIAANASSAGAQYVELLSGTAKIPGDAANGLDVDVTRLPSLPAGTNNIGDVDVLTLPALPAGSNEIGRVRITDGTLTASVRDTGSSDALNVAIVDASGNQITSLGTEYTEDAAAPANPVGPAMMARRRDTPTAAEVSADGDVIALNATSEGALRVAVSGNVTVADGGGSVTVDDGGGSVSIDDNGGSVTVDGTLSVTGIGSGATDLGKAEDASHVTGDVGVLMLGVRRDTPTSGVNNDGDYTALSTDSTGALRVTGGGGGTQYTEDAAAATDPVGNAMIVVRDDARGGALTSANGDNVALRGTNAGELYVKHVDTLTAKIVDASGNDASDDANNSIRVTIVSGGGTGGTAQADDGAFTVGSSNMTPVGGTYRSSRDTVDDNDAGAFAMTQRRAVYAALETPAGDSLADDTADAVKIVGPVASGVTVAGGPLLAGARAGATPPSPVGADGTAVALRASRQGELMTTIVDDGGDSCMDNTNNAVRVNLVAGSSSGGTAMTDDAAFTPGTTSVTPVAGTYRSSRDSVDDNDAGALAMTQKRGLLVALETVNGTSMSDESLGSLKVSPQFALKVDDLVATGDLTTTDAVVFESADGRSVVGIMISGTFSATLSFEGTVDGSLWFAVSAFAVTAPSTPVQSTGSAGRWFAQIGGLNAFRVRASSYSSGTASVRLNFSMSPAPAAALQVAGIVDTELPAAATLADTTSNPTTPLVGAALELFNGTTWDRWRGDITNGARVQVLAQAMSSDKAGTGNIVAAAGTSALAVSGSGTACLELRGTFTATLVFEGTQDGTNWFTIPCLERSPTPGNLATGSTTTGFWFVPCAGLSQVRVRASAHSSGTVSVNWNVSSGTSVAHVTDGAGSLTVDSAQLPAALVGGRLDVAVGAALPAGTNNIGDVDVLTLPGVTGAAAHDAAVSGNPLLSGFEARSTNPTAVSDGDAVRGMADQLGKQIVQLGAPQALHGNGKVTLTNTTASDVLAAAGSGVRWVVTNIKVVNGHATVGTKVEIRDGTTVIMQDYAAALGGGYSMSNPAGIFRGTANTAITARDATTGADVDVFISGYKENT